MLGHNHASLQPHNAFGIAARARVLVPVASSEAVQHALQRPDWAANGWFVLGGGSNLVLTGDVPATVLKVEIGGMGVVDETPRHVVVQAGAGVGWHALVQWTLALGLPGLENLALIPGTVGAAPVQNIGAYGVELQDRFDSLDAIDLRTGQPFTLDAAQCGFGYRHSVFKRAPRDARDLGLKGVALITRVRLALPKDWRAELSYQDLQRKVQETGITQPSAQQIADWVVAIRQAKLPDPAVLGNAGSFFKNPTVSSEQCADIIGRDPGVVHYVLPNGQIKLAAGWLIDACGWRGKGIGNAAVYERQALVLVNRGSAEQPVTGGEVMTLARAIQTSVYERFGIRLEPEPDII
jgi:UDP-N-acetylmuramate dehydrogenase